MVRRWLSMLALALAASHAWLACADTQDDDGLNPQPLPPGDSDERESPTSEGSGSAGGDSPGTDDASDGGDASVSDGSKGDG